MTKFTKSFSEIVKTACSFIDKSLKQPVLQTLRFNSLDGTQVAIYSTDLADHYRGVAVAEVKGSFDVCVSAEAIGKVLSKVKDVPAICVEADSLHIKTGDYKFKLPIVCPGEDFPVTPRLKKAFDVVISDESSFVRTLKKLSGFCTKQNANRAYSGVLVAPRTEDMCDIVSTDIHRLVLVESTYVMVPQPVVISADSIKRIDSVFIPTSTSWECSEIVDDPDKLGVTTLMVCDSQQRYITGLLKNEFPNYRMVTSSDIVDRLTFDFTFNRKGLMEKTGVICDFYTKAIPVAKLTITGESMLMSCDFVDVTVPAVPVKVYGDVVERGLNPKYLHQALQVFDDINVHLQMNHGLKPVFVTGFIEGCKAMSAIMPLRIDG